MAMSGSLVITNQTGSIIKFTQINPVNDDPTFTLVPKVGVNIPNNGTQSIEMSNDSIVIAPRGIGASCQFICQGNFEIGTIYFDDPAVGAHTLNTDNIFKYAITNPGGGNSYSVTISL